MKNKVITAAAVLCATVLVAIIAFDFFMSASFSASFIAMNTTVSADIKGLKAEEAYREISEELKELDAFLLSRTSEDSQIYKLNNGKTDIDPEPAKLLSSIKDIEEKSNFSFCVGLGQLTDLWGIGTDSARLPRADEISSAIKDAEKWQISGNTVDLPDGVKLDLGAAGKGIGCDYASDILQKYKCKSAVVAVGGSVLLYSTDKDEVFTIGIRNPKGDINEPAAIIEIKACCVSTSGTYERFFEQDGKRYHHIFDPSTGYPAESGLQSVTVISSSGLVSDALSTACLVLGFEESLPLLKEFDAQAVFITDENKVMTTPDFEGLKIADSNFTLVN